MNDDFVGRREVDQLLATHDDAVGQREKAIEDRWKAHEREHAAEDVALTTALTNEREQQAQHNVAHGAAHESHDEKHKAEGESVHVALAAVDRERNIHAIAHDKEHVGHSAIHSEEQKAVTTALDAVARERTIHAEAHDKEHFAHQREHGLNNLAIEKAEAANDKRFSAVNGTRDQMNDLIRSLASKDTVEGMASDFARRWEENRKELDRRFGELHTSVVNIEKGDSTDKGKELGRSATVAIIVGAVSFVGAVLGIVIVLSNLATGS